MSSGGGSTFISYVSEAERDNVRDKKLAEGMSKIHQHPDEELEEKLLPGEIVIGNANKVIRYNVHDDSSRGISGSLTCTNFRLIFLTAEKASYDLIELKNRMLNELDILLNNVESIFVDYPNKRKRLVPGSKIKDGIQRLELHCKDFRVAAFNFKLTMKGEEKKVITAILYHSYPQAVARMFAFDYRHGKDLAKVCKIPLFRCQADWENELQRCNVPKKSWRVSVMNRKFTESPTMPAYFVVPATVKDNELTEASLQFNESRLPMWSWTDSNGCTMTRMALLRPDTEQQYYEDKLHHAIRAADPKHRPMEYFNISKLCPSCLQLQQSFTRLKNMCMPGNEQYFWDSDREWLSSLHSSKWMQHISTALTVARNAASALRNKQCNVVIQETNGINVTPVVTSLVQLMLDPTARTLDGIQALIQREWVVAGHPFLDRLGHLLQPKRKKTKQLISLTEEEASKMAPVFLLFLDCVYQMMVQFPARFEPSVTFLTVLYDATQLTAFDTFIFNNERQRHDKLCEYELHNQPYAMQELEKVPTCASLPIWAWEMQYTNSDMSLFNNPLYRMRVMDDYTKYVDQSFRKAAKRRRGDVHMYNRNGDLPDGVTSFCKTSQNYTQSNKSPTKSPAHDGKRKQSLKDIKAEEHKKKIERDSPFPLNKIRSKSGSMDRNEVTPPKKEPFKATVGGHFPKVALMPKNMLLEKQTSMTTPRDAITRFKEERVSRSKSYGETTTDDDEEEDKTEDEDLFVPLPDFVAAKNPDGEIKVRSRFSLRRKKPKEYTTECSTEEPKTYPIKLQDYTVQPTYLRLSGTVCPLYPETNVSSLKFWRQCYFRWLHWSQIYGGGPASLLQQESLLYDDIHILHNKVQMLKKELKADLPNYHATYLDREINSPSGMYFNHAQDSSENDTVFDFTSSPTSINLLSSYYPYSPITGLRSNSVIGTPMSNFLQGASFFDFIRNRGRHSRSPSGVSISRSLAQSIEDISSMTISAVSPSSSSRSVEDLTADQNSGMRNRLQSDVPVGRSRLNDLDKNTPKPNKVPPSPTSRIKESVSYETSL